MPWSHGIKQYNDLVSDYIDIHKVLFGRANEQAQLATKVVTCTAKAVTVDTTAGSTTRPIGLDSVT